MQIATTGTTVNSDRTQEIFNIVAAGLLKQNSRSIVPNVSYTYNNTRYYYMRYHSVDNKKSPIGFLIPECDMFEYLRADRDFESRSICDTELHPVFARMLSEQRIPKCAYDLLADLESMHESCEPDTWKSELIQICKNHNLELPPCLL